MRSTLASRDAVPSMRPTYLVMRWHLFPLGVARAHAILPGKSQRGTVPHYSTATVLTLLASPTISQSCGAGYTGCLNSELHVCGDCGNGLVQTSVEGFQQMPRLWEGRDVLKESFVHAYESFWGQPARCFHHLYSCSILFLTSCE